MKPFIIINCENYHTYLVNTKNDKTALKIVSEKYNYPLNILSVSRLFIPFNDAIDMENI